MREYFPEYEGAAVPHEFHSVATIQLCELAQDGFFDLSRDDWDFSPKYSDEQHARLCEKITDRYWFREIGIVPPGIWKHEFLRTMREIMPKYIHLYEMLDKNPQLMNARDEYYKGRNVFSDFPQTRLAGNSDYASTGNDTEYERVYTDSIIDYMEKLENYKDVDTMILDEIEPLFSSLYTVNMNAW